MSYAGSVGAGGITAGGVSTASASDQRTITVTPDYANGTYTVRDGGTAAAFSLPEFTPVPNPDNRYVSLSDGGDDRLILFNNLAAGTGTNYPYLQLHYLSFAFHYENDSGTDEHRTTALLFGMPTPLADVPTSGSATYTTQGYASALRGYGLFADVGGELTANFGTGTIENTFTISDYNGASVMPFYRMAGSGAITSGTPFFSGSLAGVGNTLTGSYTGSFFGPAADEVGFTFAVAGQEAGGAEQRIVGAAGGKR